MSRITPARLRGRTWRALLVTALAVVALPAAAQASIIEEGPDGNLQLREDGSEINNVNVIDGLPNSPTLALEVRDLTGIRSTTGLCASVSTIRVRCALGMKLTRMELGGNNDNFAYGVPTPVVVFGGSGNDGYTGGTGPEGSRVVFHGQTGFDSVNYAPADRGVRINNVGFLNSGRVGLDADSISSDVEIYEGSRFNDEITDESAGGLPKTLRGRLGDDRLSGARHATSNTTFDMGGVADGADDVFGGNGFSVVDYSRRTKPLFITAGHIADDDGEAGERDNIVTRESHINGGSAGDRISASEFSIQPLGISAGAGDDRLEGSAGNDHFDGGPGVDLYVARGGDDRIFARDGVSEVIGCGSGDDDIAQVDRDDVTGGCETRNAG